jgi:hypothetical protein
MQRFIDQTLPTAEAAIRAIEHHLQHMASYAMWRVGAAADPDQRYGELSEPPFWAHWRVANEAVAKAAVSHFVAKGMQADACTQPNPAFVFIY